MTGNHASWTHHRSRLERGLFGSIAKGLKIDGQHMGTAVYNKRSPVENRESMFDFKGHFHDCYKIFFALQAVCLLQVNRIYKRKIQMELVPS